MNLYYPHSKTLMSSSSIHTSYLNHSDSIENFRSFPKVVQLHVYHILENPLYANEDKE